MTSETHNGNKDSLTREQRRAVQAFGLAVGAGIIAYQAFFANFLSLFVHQIGFSSLLIGTLFLAIQLPAICQIWAARYADRHGCRRLLVNFLAWGPLTLAPFVLAPQAAQWFGRGLSAAGIFLGLVAFSLCSAIAMAAWMPMLRHNLPSAQKAQLVGRSNQIGMVLALVATLAYSLFLGKQPALWQFQVIFVVSALLAASRAAMLRNLRDVDISPDHRPAPLWHDLRELWANLSFRRLIVFQAIMAMALGIVLPFRPLYVKDLGFSTWFAAFVTSSLVLGAYAVMAQAWGRLADRYGSRGVFVVAGAGVTLAFLLPVLPRGNTTLDGAIIVVGFAAVPMWWAGFDSGSVHRLFSIVPRRNQSLYMALYLLSIGISMSLGSFLGGLLIEGVRPFLPEGGAGGFALALEYRIMFVVVSMLTGAGTLYSLRMRDMKELSTAELLLDLRLRTQRRLMNGRAAGPLRSVGEPSETDER